MDRCATSITGRSIKEFSRRLNMVSHEIVNGRLREMTENILLLEELKSTPLDEFCHDPKKFKLARYCLQLSIQCLLDVCHHIIVDNNWPRPKSNQEAIEIIAGNKIIPKDFAAQILPMTGLRNILVHEYLEVDSKRIYGYLQNLQDFREFQKHILAYLQNNPE